MLINTWMNELGMAAHTYIVPALRRLRQEDLTRLLSKLVANLPGWLRSTETRREKAPALPSPTGIRWRKISSTNVLKIKLVPKGYCCPPSAQIGVQEFKPMVTIRRTPLYVIVALTWAPVKLFPFNLLTATGHINNLPFLCPLRPKGCLVWFVFKGRHWCFLPCFWRFYVW